MVEYRWKKNPVNILNMELAEFDLTKTEYSMKDVEYVAGIDRSEFLNYHGMPGHLTLGVLHTWPTGPGVAGIHQGYSPELRLKSSYNQFYWAFR